MYKKGRYIIMVPINEYVDTLINARRYEICNESWRGEEPKLIPHLKKVYKRDDFNNLTKESIERDIKNNRKRGIQKEWISYEKEYAEDDKDYPKDYKRHLDKIKMAEKLDCIMIWNDGGGTELGLDLKTKRIYCFDHDWGIMSDSITIEQLLKLF